MHSKTDGPEGRLGHLTRRANHWHNSTTASDQLLVQQVRPTSLVDDALIIHGLPIASRSASSETPVFTIADCLNLQRGLRSNFDRCGDHRLDRGIDINF